MPVCGSCRQPLGSLLGLLGPKESGAVPVLPPSCRHPAQALLLQHSHGSVPAPLESPCPPTEMGVVAPKPRGSLVALSLLKAIPISGGAARSPWHHAGIDSACCTSPSAFKTQFWTCLIPCVKSSKICKCFQPGNSVTRGFTPCFLKF